MNADNEKSKELEEAELRSIAGGVTSDDDQPPPDDDGREPTGTDPNSGERDPSDDPIAPPAP